MKKLLVNQLPKILAPSTVKYLGIPHMSHVRAFFLWSSATKGTIPRRGRAKFYIHQLKTTLNTPISLYAVGISDCSYLFRGKISLFWSKLVEKHHKDTDLVDQYNYLFCMAIKGPVPTIASLTRNSRRVAFFSQWPDRNKHLLRAVAAFLLSIFQVSWSWREQ